MPRQRLRWHVLKCFGALPTEERAKAMREEDYLWCAVNLLLDEEEVARQLCPQCREAAERARCPVCGRETGEMVREENPTFDWARLRKRRSGNLRWDCPVGRGEGEKTNFSRKTGKGRWLRHQTQDSVGLLRRRGVWRTAGGPGERMCWRP